MYAVIVAVVLFSQSSPIIKWIPCKPCSCMFIILDLPYSAQWACSLSLSCSSRLLLVLVPTRITQNNNNNKQAMVHQSRSSIRPTMSSSRLLILALSVLALASSSSLVQAHGGHGGGEDHSGATYAERHMMTEHHIDSWVYTLLPLGCACIVLARVAD